MNLKTEITKLHYQKEPKGFVFNLLKFASIFYGIGSFLKNLLIYVNLKAVYLSLKVYTIKMDGIL